MKRVGAIGKKTVVLASALALSSCVASSAFALSSSDSGALQNSAEIVAATEVGTGVVSGEGSSENESADIPSYGWYLNEVTGDWSFYKDSMLVKGWLSTGGFWYWFDDQGIMATGLTLCNGVFYFLNPGDCSGPVGAMQTGWVFDSANNVWRHFDASGPCRRAGCLQEVPGIGSIAQMAPWHRAFLIATGSIIISTHRAL